MYIEEETELAFDDITPEDPDFAAIQGMGNRTSYMLLRSHLTIAAFESFLKQRMRCGGTHQFY